MAHKNMVGGTAYDTKGGKCLVGGTGYAIKKGRTLVGGTGYDVAFSNPVVLTFTGTGYYTTMSTQPLRCFFTVDGTRYYKSSDNGDYIFEAGTEVVITIGGAQGKSYVRLNGTTVLTVAANNKAQTYTFALTGDATIKLSGDSYGYTATITM